VRIFTNYLLKSGYDRRTKAEVPIMVTKHSIEEQLKKIGFNYYGWGRTEVRELPDIILPDEEIFECVNGIYEGGFALLAATNIRVILVDKKPMNYLTVEDLRFDMINEIDYSHRLLGARISISTGSKNLRFTSLNQQRLRKLIGHVQHCMAEMKLKQSEHQEDQKLHLEQINQQLQAYLLAQYQQQQKLQEQLQTGNQQSAAVEPVRPSPQLSDYLYAQSLLAQHQAQTNQDLSSLVGSTATAVAAPESPTPAFAVPSLQPQATDLYAEGVQEVFGKHRRQQASAAPVPAAQVPQQPSSSASSFMTPLQMTSHAIQHALDVNPLRIAHSKLPMAMRNRKFGRPSFHAHSQSETETEAEPEVISTGSPGIVPAHY
jgi:hypothetical protein